MLHCLPSIDQIARSFRSRELQPEDLIEHCLTRIRQLEDRVQAWVFVDETGARAQAERQGQAFRQGCDPGPLAGIPIAVKDIIDVAGWPTMAGSRLRQSHIAAHDATLVRRLREAGAIILGKTVTTEFACFDPSPTRNPWNLLRTPGGSSSGSAAAVATEMCVAAIGTQTGGSIIRPSSFCGVVGFKPTFGAIPLDGVVPVSLHLDHAGPITRSANDALNLYQYLCDANPNSPATSAPPRLRFINEFFSEDLSPQIQFAWRTAREKLQDAIASHETLRLPQSFHDVHRSHRLIMAVEAAAYHREPYAAQPAAFGPNISSLLEFGFSASAIDYATALQHQLQFRNDIRQMLQENVIAVMPATNTTAPGLETTGDPKFQSPWSFAGVPSITIPGGLSDDGLPWGLQLVGNILSERQLIRAAEGCETQLGFTHRPQILS